MQATATPGVFRVAAGLLGIQGDTDDGTVGHAYPAGLGMKGLRRDAAVGQGRRAPSGTPMSCAFSVSATIA